MGMATAVILAGGQSTRMGRDKLTLPLEGEALLQRALRRYRAVFPRVLVSVADMDKYPALGDARVADRYPGAGPMAGLHAALLAAGDDVFLTAADMPFSDPAAAMRVAALCGRHAACVLTDGEGRWEPLFGFYRQAALPQAEALLASGRRSMAALLERVPVRALTAADLGDLWEPRLLLNVNNPADYEKLRLELGE